MPAMFNLIVAALFSSLFSFALAEIKTDSKVVGPSSRQAEVNLNELATIINSMVEKAIEAHDSPVLSLEPVEDIQSAPMAMPFADQMRQPQPVDMMAKRGFQFYGARGKKAFDLGDENFLANAKRFNYMPSRG